MEKKYSKVFRVTRYVMLVLLLALVLGLALLLRHESECCDDFMSSKHLRPVPEHVHVGDTVYRVEIAAASEMGQGKYAGLFEKEKQLIRIRAGLSPNERGETLVHDILHAVFYESGAGLNPTEAEDLISLISPKLYTAISRHDVFCHYKTPEVKRECKGEQK